MSALKTCGCWFMRGLYFVLACLAAVMQDDSAHEEFQKKGGGW